MNLDPRANDESESSEPGQIDVRQPAPAPRFRRALGWLFDYSIVILPGLTLVVFALASLVQGSAAYVGAVSAQAGWEALVRLVTHRGAGSSIGLREIASDEWFNYAWQLIGVILLVPLMQFLYQWGLLAWRGRTFGKMITDTRVAVKGTPDMRVKGANAFRRAFGTTLLETGLVSIALVIMVIGQLSIGAAVWTIAVVAFCVNLLAGLGPQRRTIIDRISGTVVVRRSLYADAAKRTVHLARTATDTAVTAGLRTSEFAISAGRKGADAAVTAGKAVSDATVVAGQLARSGAEAVARSAPVQQVLGSRVGQQAQAIGAIGAEHAHRLSDQTAKSARQLGGRARQLWQDRQAKRQQTRELTEAPTTADDD